MKIVVLDIAASKTGAVSILKDFAAYLNSSPDDHEWIFVTGVPGLIEETGRIRVILREDVKRSWPARLKFEWFTGTRFLEELNADAVFSLENTLPKTSLKSVLYVHQPLGYQTGKRFSFFKKEERHLAVYQHLISRLIDGSVRRAGKTIVQTEWMRQAVIKKCGVSENRVIKILPELPELSGLYAGDPGTAGWRNDRFFFPAGPILYKNHSLVIEAAILLNKRGIKDFRVTFTLSGEEAGAALTEAAGKTEGNIVWAGSLPRKEVIRRYREETLVFPSYIETFGYPPAEARALGGNVLASDTPFCREVLEGYKCTAWFNPFDAESLASLMEEVIAGRLFSDSAGNVTEPGISGEEKGSSWGRVVKEIVT
ncbi:MAG: glycosyltransferase [Lachnospiraceae bacterium]|nr:glycosyltransferase [Lachnospiraceae bacterium]